jgi:hypothetical protein
MFLGISEQTATFVLYDYNITKLFFIAERDRFPYTVPTGSLRQNRFPLKGF